MKTKEQIKERTLELLEQAKANKKPTFSKMQRLGHPNPKSLYNRPKESKYKQAEKALKDYILKSKPSIVIPKIVILILKDRYKLTNYQVFLLIRYKYKLLKLYRKNGTIKKKRTQTFSYPSDKE